MTRNLVPDPPTPFSPETVVLREGHELYRVHSNKFAANEFNPGLGSPSRFAFFGSAPVPSLYATDTEAAAVCETILHEVPVGGGSVRPRDYETRVASRITTTCALSLASFLGTGLRRLRVDASQLTATESAHYGRTVAWAEAAHNAGFDGVAYMSKRCNSDRAYLLFGDRVGPRDFVIDAGYRKAFASADDVAWLSDFCAPLGVDVLVL